MIDALNRRGKFSRSDRSGSDALAKYASAQPVLSEPKDRFFAPACADTCPRPGRRAADRRLASDLSVRCTQTGIFLSSLKSGFFSTLVDAGRSR
jgi:hypothetical protein